MQVTTTTVKSLIEQEKIIEKGLDHFIKVGQALKEIRDNKLWKQGQYESFVQYCADRWGLQAATAYNRIKVAETKAQLEEATLANDTSYSAVLELGRADNPAEVLENILQRTENITAKVVKEQIIVDKFKREFADKLPGSLVSKIVEFIQNSNVPSAAYSRVLKVLALFSPNEALLLIQNDFLGRAEALNKLNLIKTKWPREFESIMRSGGLYLHGDQFTSLASTTDTKLYEKIKELEKADRVKVEGQKRAFFVEEGETVDGLVKRLALEKDKIVGIICIV